MSENIQEAVSAILAAGGFAPMPAGEMKGLLCKECAGGYWMGGVHANGVYSKHTAISSETTYDPIQAAHELVAHVPRTQTAEEIGRAYSDANDLAMYSEPEETPAHEDDAETGAAEVDESAGDGGVEQEQSSDPGVSADADFELSDDQSDFEGGGGEDVAVDLGAEILDADFYEPTDPLIEGADFAEAEDYAGGAFIFGDNLHQLRTSAIGLVVQAALERMPLAIDYARMSELRNFTMGVSEGRWPDDPDKREELDTLEATERLRRAVEAARDTKVAALLSATREEIEAFDVEDGWPA